MIKPIDTLVVAATDNLGLNVAGFLGRNIALVDLLTGNVSSFSMVVERSQDLLEDSRAGLFNIRKRKQRMVIGRRSAIDRT